jgi:SAM-dependent methyltransferase
VRAGIENHSGLISSLFDSRLSVRINSAGFLRQIIGLLCFYERLRFCLFYELHFRWDVQLTQEYIRKYKYRDAELAQSYDQRKFEATSSRRKDQAATRRALDSALRFLQDGQLILDLPAGTGRWTDFVLGRRFRYIGGDIAREMLHVTQDKHAGISRAFGLAQMDATALPLPDQSVDCVMTFKFLSLLPENIRTQALKEMHRISRKYLIAQSKHLRYWDPVLQLKLRFSRLTGATWRIKKYESRRALPGQISSAGWNLVCRIAIRPFWWNYLWPFGVEYLAVYEKVPE